MTVVEEVDEFPIGMRVLAVDDDPTCLLILGTLLRRCQYHVTTTNQAVMALKMLRENNNRFDLVISDVVMPDMDGFQLLEIVGLEMDLPVIMLSGNGDTKLVMKGIAHGACDYLLKPIRIEELKNIWQHVIRRRKMNRSDNQDNHYNRSSEVGEMVNSDQNAKLDKRRKDEDEDDDRDENINDDDDDDDPSTPKKPRVVWSVELHRKFVAAVNQLGIDKAVPKKILDLMNVDKLTRENVASHLQKFRLYLKRISCVANQQASMVAAFGGANPSFLHSPPLDGLANFRNFVGRPQFTNPGFRPYHPPVGIFDRLNTPTGLDICGLPSTGMIQLRHEQNSNSFATGHESILQGMPTSLEIDKLQRNKNVTQIGPTAVNNTTGFPVSSGLPDARKNIGHNYLRPGMNSPLACQDTRDRKVNGNQPSVTVCSLNSGYSPNLYNDDNWSRATQCYGIQPNSYPLRDSGSEIALPIENQYQISSISPIPGTKPDIRCQDALIDNSVRQWNHNANDFSNCANLICGTNGAAVPFNDGGSRTLGLSLDSNNSFYHRSTEFNAIEHSNLLDPLPIKDNEINFSAMERPLNQKYNYGMAPQRQHGGFISNNVGYLEDLVNAVAKEERGKGKGV